MSDPDLLAIQRKRRQERRCVRCGVAVPRAVLCVACREAWRYCPRCEAVYPRADARQPGGRPGCASEYCRPCGNRLRNGERPARPEWRASVNAARDARIARALRLRRQGLSYGAIGERMGLSRGAVSGLIAYAKRLGRWPKLRGPRTPPAASR